MNPISQQVDELLERQLRDWDTVARNYDALSRVRTRELQLCDDATGTITRIVLQFNPERIRSSAAKVDAAALKARKCFLCDENQPAEQELIDWHGRYKIQVNPYPIFPRHLTIACRQHTPQLIQGRIPDMIAMAHDLPGWVLFYNGPRCGASAPDHMHFQAGNADFLPALQEVESAEQRVVHATAQASLALVQGLSRPIFLIQSTDDATAAALFECLQQAMPLQPGDPEPMQNILCWAQGGEVRIAVFPRRKHRPACYGSGVGQFTLSPASVDMGGVWAVPVERDYASLTAAVVQGMFQELCSTPAEIREIINRLDFSVIK